MGAACCLLDLLVDVRPLQVTPGAVHHCDDTAMTWMHQRHGLCTSGHGNDDTASPSDVAMGDIELRGTGHVGRKAVVADERLDFAGLQRRVQPKEYRAFGRNLCYSRRGEWWYRKTSNKSTSPEREGSLVSSGRESPVRVSAFW